VLLVSFDILLNGINYLVQQPILFAILLTHNSLVANQSQEETLGEQALSLTVRCLNFDFIGTNPDESTEDVGTIQAPTTWRPVLQESTTIELLFEFYKSTTPPRSSKSMEAIILLCSVRRSLFPTDKDRGLF